MLLAKVRKSGNSTVLVIPPEIIKERHLKVGENVEYQLFKKVNLKSLLGVSKHLKIDAQKAKDELRKEW